MLVTVATYKAVTGDAGSYDVNVSARIEDATERLEEALDRPLEMAVRTEVMIPMRGMQWGTGTLAGEWGLGALAPRATPIMVAPNGYYIDGNLLIGTPLIAWPDAVFPMTPGPSIVYTGGYVERTANPSALNRLPMVISDAICWAVYQLLHPVAPDTATVYPVGASSVTLGDASVSFRDGPPNASQTAAMLSEVCWPPSVMRYRYRPVRGV